MLRSRRLHASALAVIIGVTLAACVAPPPAAAPAAAPQATTEAHASADPAAPTATFAAPEPAPAAPAAPAPSGDDGAAAQQTEMPPESAAAWAELELRAIAGYERYLELSAGLSGDAAADTALLEQVATPEHAAAVVTVHQSLADMDGRFEGQLRVESFELLESTEAMVAHVCHDVSEVRVIQISTGEVLDHGAQLRELLVGFALTADGRMVVTAELPVAEHERTCP